ncbi:MAG: thiol-disulfide oxidoreductase DCC family protein [Ilumatobacteraceae bacterium]|jgi:predicted DCC family thiol-disulfide oxidoreductase YuxK
MSATLTTPVLVFDGECTFCRSCVRFAERIKKRNFTSVAYQDVNLSELGLRLEECAQAVQWVEADKSHVAAHEAVAAVLCSARFPWPIAGRVMMWPGVRSIAALVYRRVARQRQCIVTAPTPPDGA